jgi:hypothetical protein
MKKSILILSVLFFMFGLTAKAQTNNQVKEGGYCILKVYGNGWGKSLRGIFIAYEDSKVEKKDLLATDQGEILKTIMENITIIKNKGYILVSSSVSAAGSNGAEINEYVFKKEEK